MVPPIDLVWGVRRTEDVAGVEVHVETVSGRPSDPERPVIAALHGFASGTFTWAGVAPLLASDYAVVAWDRPPFGRSGRPRPRRGEDDPYGIGADIDRAVRVLGPELGTAGVILVGHSAGALLSVQLVRAGVLPVRGVVLIAPALDGAPPAAVRRLVGLRGLDVVAVPALRVAILGAAPTLRRVSGHRSPLTDATAAETGRVLRRPGTAAALWHLTARWQPADLVDGLGPLGVPTMVIGGRDDRISTPVSTKVVAEGLGADLHLLDGVGHAPQEQAPEVVADLIGAFAGGIGR